MNLFRHSGIPTLKMGYSDLAVLSDNQSSLRLSSLKVYVHLFALTRDGTFDRSSTTIGQQIRMHRQTVSSALKLLGDLNLVHGDKILADHNHFFQVPRAYLLSDVYRDQAPASVLIYLTLLANGNQKDSPHIWTTPKELAATLKLDKRTVDKALDSLAAFLKVEPGEIVILDPRTGQILCANKCSAPSLPIPAEEETPVESTGDKIRFPDLLTPENFRRYYALVFPEILDDANREQWNFRCEFHEDQHPSLSINIESGVFKCHAPSCRAQGGITEFEMRLLPSKDRKAAHMSIASKLGYRLTGTLGRKITDSEHVYVDEEGQPISRKVRCHHASEPVNARTCVYHWSPISKKWIKGLLPGTRRLLYNLPEVVKARTVILAEGETKVDPLMALRLVDSEGQLIAVTTSGSVTSWQDEFAEYLRGKRVLVFPDSDHEGGNYAKSIVASLSRRGIEYKVADFSVYGNDVRDMLKTEHFCVNELLDHVECDWLAGTESEIEIKAGA
jgi:5S rRNA maturation endonuclease (ribonuclease M5)